jgi:hypothetical protein
MIGKNEAKWTGMSWKSGNLTNSIHWIRGITIKKNGGRYMRSIK